MFTFFAPWVVESETQLVAGLKTLLDHPKLLVFGCTAGAVAVMYVIKKIGDIMEGRGGTLKTKRSEKGSSFELTLTPPVSRTYDEVNGLEVEVLVEKPRKKRPIRLPVVNVKKD